MSPPGRPSRADPGEIVSDTPGNDPRERAWAKGLYPRPMNEGRSRNMRANRRANTKPEVALRSALHARGYRYRKDLRLDLPDGVRVRPDIVFTARKVAIFVDGCFWHVCPEHGREPTTNEWYWTPKLRRNMERDRQANAALEAAGWRVVRLWEHEPLPAAVDAVVEAVGPASAERKFEGTGEGRQKAGG
jgi:DNA mismatch endonuclease (patch repair protein)